MKGVIVQKYIPIPYGQPPHWFQNVLICDNSCDIHQNMAETPQFYSPGVGDTSSVFHPKWKRPPQYQAFEPLHHQIIQRSYFILFWWPTKKGGRQSLSSFILLRFRILFFFLGDVVGRSPTAQNDLHAPRIFAAHVAEGTSQVVPQTETTPKPSTCHVWDIEVDFGWVWGW